MTWSITKRAGEAALPKLDVVVIGNALANCSEANEIFHKENR